VTIHSSTRTRTRRAHKPSAKCPISGKYRYDERHDAQLALKSARNLRSSLAVLEMSSSWTVVRAYRCECFGWHLTSRAAQSTTTN